MMDLEDCLKTLNKYRTDEVVVCTMTQNQYWPFISNSRADVLLTDPMGSASSLALGSRLPGQMAGSGSSMVTVAS